jgi:predicted neuraminidase
MPESRTTTKRRPSAWTLLLAVLAALALLWLDRAGRPGPVQAAQAVGLPVASGPAPALATPLRRAAGGTIPMPDNTPAAHASSLLALPAGHAAALMAFWFAGTRESAPDVQIAASQFERASGRWTPARFVLNRHDLGAELGFAVRRLGNPVAWLDQQGRIHLFVVATGLGGWAASRVVHLRQRGDSADLARLSFAPVQVLPLGWWWNTSFLVRNAALPLADGGMVLPVHFELGIKWPMALRFDATGRFLGAERMSTRRHLLQASLLPLGPSHWIGLMRDQRPDGRVTVVQTRDAGRSWQDAPDLALVNPDASVVGLALAPNRLLLAHNSSPRDRSQLDLSQSADGLHWQRVQSLVHDSPGMEFSYPALAWADDSLWVSYTDQRRRIAWQRFVASEATP